MSNEIKEYYVGVKITEVLPQLKRIAIENGLRLCRLKEFNIAKKILATPISNK